MAVSTMLKKWADEVKKRDEFKCRICDSQKTLHAHHIIPRKQDSSKWYDINNGITLCNSCHAKAEGFKKGRVVTQEIKDKISQSCKGRDSWSKGKKLSKDHAKKISDSLLGHTPWNKGLKGVMKAWNKGKKAPEHVKENLREQTKKNWEKRKLLGLPGPRTGTKNSEETRKKLSESLKKAYAEGRRKSMKGIKKTEW